ncbi:hypothetical protein DERP_011326 [Dermatophagoides pteronyssinus]|uniref:Uncharacterized protein n=1 Tax=Dermatophagoides pteronyssinus TaxID=6956 RepID=A0ABQ8J7D1_DERPT|nr:hypothetical protein DERP_011326 [Dermatophagoides pteronyssinus]
MAKLATINIEPNVNSIENFLAANNKIGMVKIRDKLEGISIILTKVGNHPLGSGSLETNGIRNQEFVLLVPFCTGDEIPTLFNSSSLGDVRNG